MINSILCVCEVQKLQTKLQHTRMLNPFRPGLSKACYDNDKTYQLWPDAFGSLGEGRAHRQPRHSQKSDDTKNGSRVAPLFLWPVDPAHVRDPRNQHDEGRSFMAWIKKPNQGMCSRGQCLQGPTSRLHPNIAPIYQDEKGQSLCPRAMGKVPSPKETELCWPRAPLLSPMIQRWECSLQARARQCRG